MTSLNKNKVKIKSQDVEVFYNKFQALYEINMDVEENRVTALIGPSGCGKSTFLRTLNRLNELIPGTEVKGQVFLDGQPIYSQDVDVVALRKKWAWYSKSPRYFPCLFMIMLPTILEYTVLRINMIWTVSCITVRRQLTFGMK